MGEGVEFQRVWQGFLRHTRMHRNYKSVVLWSAGQCSLLVPSFQEHACCGFQLVWWGWNWERMFSVLVVNLWAKGHRKVNGQCWWQRRDSLTHRAPVLHSASLVWEGGEGSHFFPCLCWCLCPPALIQGCVCSVCGSRAGQGSRCLDASLFLNPVARLVDPSSLSPESSLL